MLHMSARYHKSKTEPVPSAICRISAYRMDELQLALGLFIQIVCAKVAADFKSYIAASVP